MTARKFFLASLFTLSLSACASAMKVQVNAINDPTQSVPGKAYYMKNAKTAGGEDELFFREFSTYFAHALQAKGYQRVEDPKSADLIIHFGFGVSEGRTGIHTYTWPIYETVGGETITYTETKTDASGTKTTTKGSVSVPLRVQRVGTQVESRSYTVFTHHASLEARGRKENNLLWKAMITLVNESTDLRASMPYLAAAAAPYLGGNSGKQRSVSLERDNPAVVEMRRLIQPASAK